jgi:hypothetical protein
MLVKELVEHLLKLDQEKELNFTFGAEHGRSYSFGHSGELATDFEEDEDGKIVFSLDFEEDNVDSQ